MKDKTLNALLIVLTVALTLAATWWMDGRYDSASITPPRVALSESATAPAPAPHVKLTKLNGQTVNLHDYAGKIVLLNFWATWCTPCIAEWPQFIRLARAMPDDLVILAVSIDDDKGKIAPFMKRYAGEYQEVANIALFHDADKSVSQDLFQTVRVPETIVITPEMTMARKVAGLGLVWDSEDTKTYLRSLKKN